MRLVVARCTMASQDRFQVLRFSKIEASFSVFLLYLWRKMRRDEFSRSSVRIQWRKFNFQLLERMHVGIEKYFSHNAVYKSVFENCGVFQIWREFETLERTKECWIFEQSSSEKNDWLFILHSWLWRYTYLYVEYTSTSIMYSNGFSKIGDANFY